MNAGPEFSMSDRQQDSVYAFVERAYMRLQAGDVLIRCLEEGKLTPIQEMVEGLVVAGPENIATLREILGETGQRKVQVQDDLHQVFTQFSSVMKSFGVALDEKQNTQTIQEWTASRLLELMLQQGVREMDTQTACLQVWQDSREIMENLCTNLSLLSEVELYLQDWVWGLAYSQVRRQADTNQPDIDEPKQYL